MILGKELPPCVILSGGRGTRMRPFTATAPKCLIPVNGLPFLDHQLALVSGWGFRRVVLSIGHRGDMVRAHAGDGRRFGLDIAYVDEGDRLRGTGGALRLA